jgi:hypothetical protein
MSELALILAHFVHVAVSAHALEAGIILTNVYLARVTFRAIPRDERPHRKLYRRVVRHHYRQDRLTVPMDRHSRYVEFS